MEEMKLFLILTLGLLFTDIKGHKDTHDVQDPKKLKEEQMKILKTHQMHCIEETRVDPNLIIKLKAGNWKRDPPILKQWALCVLMRLGLMSLEGVYRLDEALIRIPEKDQKAAEKIIDDCLSTKAIPAQEIAWNYVKCHHHKDPLGNFSSISIIEPRWK